MQAYRSLELQESVPPGMQRESLTQSSRLDDVVTVVQAIVKEPIREAVREALEDERRRAESESIQIEESPKSDSGGMGGSLLKLGLGLLLVSYLVKRRDKVMEASPGTDRFTSQSSSGVSNQSTDVNTTSYDDTSTGSDVTIDDE